MSISIWFVAFFAMILLDIAWVQYIKKVEILHPMGAAGWSTAIHAFGSTATLAYTNDPKYLSATLLGTFLGTWAIVRWKKYQAEKQASELIQEVGS